VTGADPASRRLARRAFGPLPEEGAIGLDELRARLGRLRALGSFESVGVEVEAPREGPARLALHVTPSPPFELALAARYDDKLGALGRAALSWRRVVGPLRDLEADLTFGEVVAATVEVRHDRLLASPLEASLAGFHLDHFDRLVVGGEDRGRLRFRRSGLDVRLALPLGGQALASLGYRLASVKTSPPEEGLDLASGRQLLAGLVGRFELDSTDRLDLPRQGARIEATVVVARPSLGSDASYALAEGAFALHRALGGLTVLTVRGRGVLDLDGPVPLSEQATSGANDLFPGLERDELRGERLGAVGVGLRRQLLALPPALGHAVLAGVEAAAGTVGGGLTGPGPGGRLLYGLGFLAALDTRAGPFELRLGVSRDRRALATVSIGPRFLLGPATAPALVIP
jgi:hypothetical protein